MTMPPEDYACAPIFRWTGDLQKLVEEAYREGATIPAGAHVDVSWPPSGYLTNDGHCTVIDAEDEDDLFAEPEMQVDPAVWSWSVDVTVERFEVYPDGTVGNCEDERESWSLGTTTMDPREVEYTMNAEWFRDGDDSDGEKEAAEPAVPTPQHLSRYAALDDDTEEIILWVAARRPHAPAVLAGSEARPTLADHAQNLLGGLSAVEVLRRCAGEVHRIIMLPNDQQDLPVLLLPLPVAPTGRVLGHSLHRPGCGADQGAGERSTWTEVSTGPASVSLLWGDCLRGEPCRPDDWLPAH